MRALLLPVGSYGDVRPFVDIGVALRDRGHEVLLAANSHFERIAQAAELDMESTGNEDEYTAVVDNPLLWHPNGGPRLLHEYIFGANLRRLFETVTRHAGQETVVIAGTLAVGAWLAAEKLAIPCARVQAQPSMLFGAHDPPTLPSGKKMGGPLWLRRAMLGLLDKTIFRQPGRDLNKARREVGLPPWPKHFMHSYVSGDVNLCLFPEWFAPATPDWPDTARHVGFLVAPPDGGSELADELRTFLDEGAPPLVFTPGPAGYQHGARFFGVAAAACAELGQRAVFVARGQKPDVELPSGVLACDYAPFAQLFARAALIIHHGGIGTVAQGLAAGCRQLIIPFGFDQPDNAWRIKKLGVGDMLTYKALKATPLTKRIAVLLASTAMAERARALKHKMDAEAKLPVATACDHIERLLA
jgi:UDP:flavonoid glycosyltransferase YjiC (YdhE family)